MIWDFWTFFWIVIVLVGLLVWSGTWIFNRYNRDLEAGEDFCRGLEQTEKPDE